MTMTQEQFAAITAAAAKHAKRGKRSDAPASLGRMPSMPANGHVRLPWRDRTSLPTVKVPLEDVKDGGEMLAGAYVRVPVLPDESALGRDVFAARPTVASAAQAAAIASYAERDYPNTAVKRSRKITSPWR